MCTAPHFHALIAWIVGVLCGWFRRGASKSTQAAGRGETIVVYDVL